MSPNEHPESQRAPEKPIPGTIKENVPLALRPLAPKAPPRFRPLAIRGSSDSLFASSSGQQTGQRRGRTENRCPVCFKRNCSLTSHKLHNEANSPRRSHALSIARIPLSQDNFAVSYAVNFAAFYDGSSASPANLKLLDQLTIPSDLNRPQMNQLFHTCKQTPFHLSPGQSTRLQLTVANRVCGRGTQALYSPAACTDQKRHASQSISRSSLHRSCSLFKHTHNIRSI